MNNPTGPSVHQVFQARPAVTSILTNSNGDCGDDSVDLVAKCKLGIRQEQRNEADKEMYAEQSSKVSLTKMWPR